MNNEILEVVSLGLAQVNHDKKLRQVLIRKRKCLYVMFTDNHTYCFEKVPHSSSTGSMEITRIQVSINKQHLTAYYSSLENSDI